MRDDPALGREDTPMIPTASSSDRSNAGLDLPALGLRLAPVLADLTFPARRWQVVAVSDLYGCDGVTRGLVDRLPERTYSSLGDLVGVLAAVLSGRTVPPSPVVPAQRPARAAVPPARAGRSGTRPVPVAPAAPAMAPASLGAHRRPTRAPVASV